MADTNTTPNDPAPEPPSPDMEALRVFLIGSPRAVNLGIEKFSRVRYAKANEWNPPLPAHRPGLVMRSLLRFLRKQ